MNAVVTTVGGTKHGRRYRNGIREIAYGLTRPCTDGKDPVKLSERIDCPESVLWEWYSQLNQEEEMERRFDEFSDYE